MRVPFLVTAAIFLVILSALPATSGPSLLSRRPDAPSLFNNPRLVESLSKGKFLVAAKHLRDPFFAESVILLISYDQNGAMGLIINKPSSMRLSTILPEIREEGQRQDFVRIGGPVGPRQFFLLIQSGSRPEDAVRIIEHVFISSNHDLLIRIATEPKADERFRIYIGYAGWAPGQLEAEVSRGDWHIVSADVKTIFDKQAPSIWPELINRISSLEVKAGQPESEDKERSYDSGWEANSNGSA